LLALDTKHLGGHCLAHIGREGRAEHDREAPALDADAPLDDLTALGQM
jgi:hypothetical protein